MILFGLLVVAGLVAVIAGAGGKTEANVRALIPGHRYKMTFRALDTRRQGASFAALEALTSKLAQLGWTSTFLEPVDAEPDPFTWNAEAIWAGAKAVLTDGLNVFFLGAQDITERADHHGRFDPDLPPAEEEAVTRALTFETDPQALRDFAASLRPQFPIAADNLETRANALSVNPNAPPSLPPVPPQPPPTPVAPFQPPPAPSPQPPTPQPDLPVTPRPSSDNDVFVPGIIPLSVKPAASSGFTTQNQQIQRALSNFFAQNPVLYPDNGDYLDAGRALHDDATNEINFGSMQGGLPSDQIVDGKWGPRSQLALWAFQTWSNHVRGTRLTVDGLPGPASAAALDEWM